MIPLSPALLVACAAGRVSGRTSYSCRLDRDHRYRSLRYPDQDDEAAGVRFINGVGFWAHFDFDVGMSSWPIPHLESVQQLARFGQQRKVLVTEPEFGDLVVSWNSAESRFTRVSIVISVIDIDGKPGEEVVRCRTLGAHKRGASVRPERFRPATGDRFVRWVELEERTFFGIRLGREEDKAA